MRPDRRRTQDERAGGLLEGDRRRALSVPDLRVYREGLSVSVSWEFKDGVVPRQYVFPEPEPGDPEPPELRWVVERSSSPGGPFRMAHPRLLPFDTRFFRDDDVLTQRTRTRALFYRLCLYRREDEAEEWSLVQAFGYNADYHRTGAGTAIFGQTWGPAGKNTALAPGAVRGMRQAIDTLIRRRAGHVVLLYRPAWETGACPQCVNPMTGTRRGTGDCNICLETKYAGGYHNPLVTLWVPTSVAEQVVPLPTGQIDSHESARILMPYWPPVAPEDVLRTFEGEFFLVSNVEHSPMYGHPTLCLTSISEAPGTHPLSRTPLPDWFREAAIGPRRQHGRAMNLEGFRASLVDGSMASAGPEPPQTLPADLDE